MSHTPEAVLEIFFGVLDEMGEGELVPSLSGASLVKDLGMDSLGLLEFLMLVEERTGVEITTDDMAFDLPLADLAGLVSRKSA